MTEDAKLSKEQKLAEKHLVFKCYAGSRSYGTNTPQSDLDVRGIFIAPPEYVIGCMKNIEQAKMPGEDTVIYELGKFVRLAAQSNPNLIELLFTEDENIIFIDDAFKQIRDERHLFLSKKAKFSFRGMSQMKRIKGHHKWINSPQPERAPEILDFANFILPNGDILSDVDKKHLENTFLVKVNATVFRVYFASNFSKSALSEDGKNLQFIDIDAERLAQATDLKFLGTLIVQQETYKKQHSMWKDYWTWKKNRNPARASLEEKYGFDVKHAMHLIRLLKMSHEILIEGKVIVRRPDAQELLDIRAGKFNYDELVAKAESMDKQLDELYESSTLPHHPDKEAINDLYIRVVQDYWKKNGLVILNF